MIGSLRLTAHPKYEKVYLDQVNRLWRIDENGLPDRTYPSWEERRHHVPIPRDGVIYPSSEDHKMARLLALQLRNDGHDVNGGLPRKTVIAALEVIRGKRKGCWTVLLRLWRCGFVDRTGSRWNEGARWRDQLWSIKMESMMNQRI